MVEYRSKTETQFAKSITELSTDIFEITRQNLKYILTNVHKWEKPVPKQPKTGH